jgi:predicted RNase H-like nuclease (RuvC/YqgF family)
VYKSFKGAENNEIEDYKSQIDHLRNENQHLKSVIKKRTEEANDTIMKLAKMKKEAEEQNMEYLKTIQLLAHNQKSLKEQVI